MKIETREEILNVLAMPQAEFWAAIAPAARETYHAVMGDRLIVTAMMGYSNICKNQCLYCGMRAANHLQERYRISPDGVIASALTARERGFHRMFLISGEDPKYGFDNLCRIVETLHGAGMFLSLACGEYTASQYGELRAAGADEYVLKFEMSHLESFDRLNPSTDFKRRFAAIEAVKSSGMMLASGNIVGWPGQTEEELADDILLMKKLEISWAPIIPYLPAAGTPLALEGVRGDLLTNLKEIAILRLMMPQIKITAQQPGENMKNGLSDPEGNKNAVLCGANTLFYDLLPAARAGSFRVIDDRNLTDTEHLDRLAADTAMTLDK